MKIAALPRRQRPLPRWIDILLVILVLSQSTAAVPADQLHDAPCPEQVFAEIHLLSLTGDEAGQFSRILETVQKVHGVEIAPSDLAAAFVELLSCLGERNPAQRLAGSESPPGAAPLVQLLDRVTVTVDERTLRIHDANGGKSREVQLRPDGSAGRTARKTVRLLEKEAGRLGLNREAVGVASWYLLVESCIGLLKGSYNYYVYVDQFVFSDAHDRGRSFRPGFVPSLKDGQVYVHQIIDPRLAEAGLADSDQIVLMDENELAGRPLADWFGRWFREQPFSFTLTVVRGGDRFQISGESVPHRHRTLLWALHEGAAYVRIDSFTAGTLTEFRSFLRRTAKQDLRGLVVDLRNNGGGIEQFGLVDIFFTPAQAVATSRRFSAEEPETVTGTVEYCGLPLVLLVNGATASMSEVFAAAVKQNGRGTLVGETTFGKGVGQRKHAIGTEGELALLDRTLYYPGTELSWDGVGIEPHVAITVGKEERKAVDAFLKNKDVVLSDHLAIDTALARALDILKEKP